MIQQTESPTQTSTANNGDGHDAIAVATLSKAFAKRRSDDAGPQALANVDLRVRMGEFLVLLGPSGCGKTTLLRSIAGLETPDSGSITIDGRVVFDAAGRVDVEPRDRPVSMIFQSYALWPHMTAGKNVAFPLECHKVNRREIRHRVQEILDTVGIGHLVDRYPGEMSGGQQQRLALARALVIGQRIVLFDEPLSNVDAQVRERLRLELLRMQRTLGFTAIYVTHDQSEALELADRVAVMDHGRVAQLGDPRDMYSRPRDIHVARFLGQSNEIPLTVEHYDTTTQLVTGSGPLGTVRAVWRHEDPSDDPPSVGESLVAFGRLVDFVVALADEDDSDRRRGGHSSKQDANEWAGSIEAIRFLGTHTQYQVKIDKTRLRAWTVAGDEAELLQGRAVTIKVSVHDLRLMREPEAT